MISMTFRNLTHKFAIGLLVLVAGAGCEQDSSDPDAMDAGVDEPVVDFDAPLIRSRLLGSDLSVGQTVFVEIEAENFPVSEGGGIDLQFDPAVARVEALDIDPGWDFVNRAGEIDNVAGRVTGVLFSSYAGRGGSIRIASIQLRIIGPGRLNLRLSESRLNPFASLGKRMVVRLLEQDLVAG